MYRRGANSNRTFRLRANSVLSERLNLAEAMGMLTFGSKRRDVYAAAGYDKTIRYDQYLSRFLRQDVAQRIVAAAVDDTWRKPPSLLDGLDVETGLENTPFTDGWLRMVQSARDGAETRRGLIHYLARLDLISRIGRYGVLYLGLADGMEPNQPATAGSLRAPEDLAFVGVYDEGSAKIVKWDTDKASPRYGKPEMYQLTTGSDGQVVTLNAHWTRCIHVADNALTSDIYGVPALEAPWNRLIDLDKIMAATGEAGWMQMQPGYLFSTKDGYELSADDADERQEQMDEFVHGLRRFLEMNGYEATTLSGSLQDPSGAVNNILKLISAATGIPLRKLTGSERGELASAQDDDNWIDVIEARQQKHVTPVIIEPVVNRLIWLGALPQPTSGAYAVWWPSLRQKNPTQQAQIADVNASALQKIGATVDPRVFAETYLPDLPANAVSKAPPAAGEFPQLSKGVLGANTTEGGGLAENAARPFERSGKAIRSNTMILQLDPDDDDAESAIIDQLAQQNKPAVDAALQKQLASVVAGLNTDAMDNVERLIPTEDDDLREALEILLRESAGRGVRVTLEKLGQVAIGVNWQLANEAARTWAQQYSYELVSRLNENSRRMLQETVSRWIGSGAPLDDLIASVSAIFGPVRGEMIAVTEATRAYAEGSFTSYEQAGFNRRPPEADRPPAHVRCRCWVSLAETDRGVWEYIWLTAQDERVCEICGPKHLTSIGFAGRR